jgi:hypothetical protein
MTDELQEMKDRLADLSTAVDELLARQRAEQPADPPPAPAPETPPETPEP